MCIAMGWVLAEHLKAAPTSRVRFRPYLGHLAKTKTQGFLSRRRAFRTTNTNRIYDGTRLSTRRRRCDVATTFILANTFKLNPVVRPCLVRVTRITTLANRRTSSTTGTDLSYRLRPWTATLSLLGILSFPSARGLDWRVEKTSGKSSRQFQKHLLLLPGSRSCWVQAALSAGHRLINCAWEYGVRHVRMDHSSEGHLIVVRGTRRQ